MAASFDEELSKIMIQFDVPQGLQTKLLAANCKELWKFAEYVDDIAQCTAILNTLEVPIPAW